MSLPRIIFVNRVYWPAQAATAQLLTDLAEGLAARGWPVRVVAAGEGGDLHEGVTIHRTGPGEQHGGLLSRWLNYRRFRRQAATTLEGLLQPGDIVVPMTDPPLLGSALAALAASRGAHVVHWIQDIYPEIVTAHLGAAAFPLRLLQPQRDAAWRTAARCVTLGRDMAEAIARRGVAAGRITVVPNWAPRELHAPATAAEIAGRRAAWGLTEKFVVAYSGNLGRVHEFAALLDAAEELKANPAIAFVFIGTGARFAEVRAAVASRDLAHVRFLPPEPRTQLAGALAAADAHFVTLKPAFADLVYPSKLAGVLAAGRPVLFVGLADGEIARFLATEQCGAAFAPGDGARLAATLVQWQADPARGAPLGRNARAAYERHFTFEAALAQWEAVLSQVAPDR